jgi:hypothetical protein
MAYSPKVGEIVTADGQTGTFIIRSLSEAGLAQIEPFNVSKQEAFGKVMQRIPRMALHSFKEDVSQAAFRIVREATEGK